MLYVKIRFYGQLVFLLMPNMPGSFFSKAAMRLIIDLNSGKRSLLPLMVCAVAEALYAVVPP